MVVLIQLRSRKLDVMEVIHTSDGILAKLQVLASGRKAEV